MIPLVHWLQELGWIGLLIAVVDLVAIVRALLRGHGVSSTLAWICAIVAFPGVGAAAYLLLANPSIRRTIRRRSAAARAAERRRASSPLPDDRRLLLLVERLTDLQTTAGNRVELLVKDEAAFARIETALAAARSTIWAEYYIVRNDETGHRFLDLLAEKARAGVKVYLLYDALGSLGLDARRLAAIRQAGGAVESFLPFNPFRRRWAVHLRNHRKLIVIDGVTVFTGGMNVGDEHSGRSRLKRSQRFRDSHLRIEGPAVREFAAVFADDWRFAAGASLELPPPSPPAPEGSWVCPIPSGPDQSLNASAHTFFAGIMNARDSCYLTTPYFIPDEPTIRALVTAARSGVDVRILMPQRCDLMLVRAAARSFYRELLMGGVRLFEYRPSMLHAKSLCVDRRWGIVGSANVDMRSFRLNFEIGALVHDPAFAGSLADDFLEKLQVSNELTLREVYRAGTSRRVVQGVARLLSPLL